MDIQIPGVFEKTLSRDEKTADTVFSFRPAKSTGYESKFGNITCLGRILPYETGMPLMLWGRWIKNDYGDQFALETCHEYTWDEPSAISYLASGSFPGISYAAAREIVQKLGCNIFQMVKISGIENKISRLVRKINLESAKNLCEKIREQILHRELLDYLKLYEGNWVSVQRLIKAYGDNALRNLKEHPYETGVGHGLDFKTCDKIGKDQGFHPASTERIMAAIKSAMWRNSSYGNVYATMNDACKTFHSVVSSGSFTEEIPTSIVLNAFLQSPDVIIESGFEERVYLNSLYEAETESAVHIERLISTAKPLRFEDTLVFYAERKCKLKYAGRQRKSFDLLRYSGIAVITGGPGTGKTSCVSGLLAAYEKMYPNRIIQLCAPTGRAAQRLSESTGREAMTIHRLLECHSVTNNAKLKNGTNLLDADLLVIDEGSMLSITLLNALLSVVRSGALVLIIGDANQLPSVEPGDVLHDFIYSGKIPVCQLQEVHRQAAGSPIVKNADMINHGLLELIENEKFEIKYSKDQTAIAKDVVSTVQKLYNPKRPFDTQVLAPVYLKEAGVSELNKKLQAMLNPKDISVELRYGNKSFRINDKVIMLSNNYHLGYFNGDLGIVTEITDLYMAVKLSDRTVYLTRDLMEDIDLAYCISIHKSQGSEFQNIILSLPGVRSLSRNLLYTAITRAKDKVVITAEFGTVFRAIQASSFGRRRSYLINRMNARLSKCA
ncbi:MAG: AAA family ATPase [Clostridiales bacterium]|jgi:exodeoxyribonuclease V alpha subunit|nr:AAA family ATPase [Clostridiales bacterium]